MKSFSLAIIITIGWVFQTHAQIVNKERIVIARDSFGVPHIFAPTDAEVAYGLAWAHAEDDFKHIQENLLAAKSMLSQTKGTSAILLDFFALYTGIKDTIAAKWETSFSPDFKKIIEAYTQALNTYATSHPHEVINPKALPFTPQDVIGGYCLSINLFSGATAYLGQILKNKMPLPPDDLPSGSNAFAYSSSKTKEGETVLVVNPHNSYEGRYSWYEAHTVSEEGTDMNGALFPGGITVFLGFNEHLGWSHTFNYHDLVDVYHLKTRKRHTEYWYDGSWRKLEKRRAHIRVKIGGIRIRIGKDYYLTPYGPALRNKNGIFATSIATVGKIEAAEQWYAMGKAKNWEEWFEAIQKDALPLLNFIYADKNSNIYFISQAHYPIRTPGFDYLKTLRGDTSATRWKGIVPFEQRPQLLNPDCGFIFNANNTPLNATASDCDLTPSLKKTIIGLQSIETNRSYRLNELLDTIGQLDFTQIKNIKYDISYPQSGYLIEGIERITQVDTTAYPEVADILRHLKSWNGQADTGNIGAMMFIIYADYLMQEIGWDIRQFFLSKHQPEPRQLVAALKKTKQYYLKHHGTLHVPLGTMQRHMRGTVNLPISGITEVPAPTDSRDLKNGIHKAVGGDSFIQFVRFHKNKPVIAESIHAYGSSHKPDSKHYTDQMQLFSNHQTKRVLTQKAEILQKAERIYHPQ